MNDLFVLSKLAWFVLAPSNLLFLLGIVALALMRFERFVRFGRRLGAAVFVTLLIATIPPISEGLLRPLENRFPPFDADASAACDIAGIIVLGGAISTVRTQTRMEADLTDASDRVRYAATLARAFPEVPVLISGGQVFPRPGVRAEASQIADLLEEFGIGRDRMIIEGSSRTTVENSDQISSRLPDNAGAWLLVTSAFHMPRALATIRHAGVRAIAAPTDWRVDDDGRNPLTFNVAGRLGNLDLAAKEYVGLLAYRLFGRTDALFPAPRREDPCQ